MTQHDQISAYIDNELSSDQEQDFLISLASSESLRKTFRSELVLKNVIHRDEVLTSPSRSMRGAVLTTLGIGAGATVASESAEAAATAVPAAAKVTALKALFASKMSALVTASVVTASALGGYGIHSVISQQSAPTVITVPPAQPAPVQAAPKEVIHPAPILQSQASAPTHTSAIHKNQVKAKAPAQTPGGTTSGIGNAGMKPPVNEKK